MANKLLNTEIDGTPAQILFRDATDFSPTAANNLQATSPTAAQLDLTSLADGSYRQSAKVDLGANFAACYEVWAAFELAATPTAGDVIVIYAGGSHNSTAATGNQGAMTGSDAAYTGESSNAAATVRKLTKVGLFVCSAQPTTVVQVGRIGYYYPSARYLSIIVENQSGAAFHSDAVETHIVFNPVVPELQ